MSDEWNWFRFRGVNRRGQAHTGVVNNGSPAELAEKLFRLGHRSLTITRDGEQVGGIGKNNEGQRTWWGEN